MTVRPHPTAGGADDPAVGSAISKTFRRLIPVLFACYVLAFLDRINFGFAALTMNADLGITLAQFGLAGTLFYAAYLLCEVPSNLLMVRFGARRWIARIMVTWGMASMGTALVTGPTGLYAARVLLGLAEAGFVPGVLLYLTYWIPAGQRGRATALFMTAQPIAIAIGSPLSGAIMSGMNGAGGLQGWQWLFIIEATPTILLGFAVLRLLPDGPASARWLTARESDALTAKLAAEPVLARAHAAPTRWGEYLGGAFLMLCGAYFALVACLSTLSTWSPLILKDVLARDADPLVVGMVAAVPGLLAAVAMPLLSASSDRWQERGWHFAVAAAVSAAGWYATTFVGHAPVQIAGLVASTMGGFSAMPILWTIPPLILSPASRPVGIALLSSAGICGSIISPLLNGLLRQATGSFVATGWVGVGWMLAALVFILASVALQRRT